MAKFGGADVDPFGPDHLENTVALVQDCANMLGEEPSPELAMMIADYFDFDIDDVEEMFLDGYDF